MSQRRLVDVAFGGEQGEIPCPAHVAYFWSSEKEFGDAVRFLEIGLRANDHCVVFGHDEANQKVCAILEQLGLGVATLVAQGRLTVLGGAPDGDAILAKLGGVFQRALAGGAPLIRLLGNIGWGRAGWPEDADLLAFEAKVTEAANTFPSVIVCMYDAAGVSGTVVRHGGLETHPFVVRGGAAEMNPHYLPTETFLRRIEGIAGAVAERKRADDVLFHLTEAVAPTAGQEFFRSLARHLAQALRVRYAFITECTDESRTQVRSIAFWDGAEFRQSVEYPLRGTPCEKVIEGDLCAYPERLQLLFPEDRDLASLDAESYAGVPLPAVAGKVPGHLVVMDDKPRVFSSKEIAILRIFAARAGVELERSRAEATLKASESKRRLLLDINNALVTKLTRDEIFRAICDALAPVVQYDRIALSIHDPATNQLRLVAYEGPLRTDYSPVGNIHDLNDSHVGWAFSKQQPLLRHDLETEQEFSSERRAYKNGFRSLCSLPLVVRGCSIGAITVASLVSRRYEMSDVDFLMEVAKQIAIAVDNMSAHEETAALKARFQAEAIYLQEEIKTEHNFEEIIGQSASLRRLLRQVEQVGPTQSTVLIRGETGTGKELLARALHSVGRRKDRPLVKVNCGSIPAGLIESELFGHEKGAFTGATQRRIGRFELADGGTIFLDEVTELPLDAQVKLLRVLQEGEFERVGSSHTIHVDARVIAATNRDLSAIVKNGSFRTDLYYRLNVFPLEVPPLRERREDIPLLVHFFLSKFGKKLGKELRGIGQKSMDALLAYGWPGNVRELHNVIERAAVLAQGPVVRIEESLLRAQASLEAGPLETLESVERQHILRALGETHWVIHGSKGAAEMLGIHPSTLRSRMEKLGIKRPA